MYIKKIFYPLCKGGQRALFARRGDFLLLPLLLLQSLNCFALNVPSLVVQHWSTTKGAQVYFIPLHRLPILDVVVTFDAGSRRDGNKPGIANLTQNLLNDGTDSLSANQIADNFDKLGAILQGNTTQDLTSTSLRTLTKPEILNAAISLFSQVITNPSFPPDAVAREKNIAYKNIQAANQDPDQIANIAFYKALYKSFPYASPILGTLDSVPQITREDVVKFYYNYFVAKNATIAIVGDITRAQAETIANKITAGLPAGQPAAPLTQPTPSTSTMVHISYPATQTAIYIGQIGIARNDPDYFPLLIGNYILGGDVSSRLFSTIREKYGLTYNISSYFNPLQDQGPFTISLLTRTDSREKALALTKQITDNFVNHGVTEDELKIAKKSLIGSFPLRIMTNANISNILNIIGFYHLPLDYFTTFNRHIDEVTLKQINTALQKRIKPTTFVTVTVGASLDTNKAV